MSMRHLNMRHLAGLALFGGVFALAACSSLSGLDGSSNNSPSTDTGGPVSISTDHAQYDARDSIQVPAVVSQLTEFLSAERWRLGTFVTGAMRYQARCHVREN